MTIIDLHMHSNHSLDGVHDINFVLDKCSEANLEIVSITDHDSCDCYNDLDKTNFKGTIIYGMEADSLVGNVTYDILCYDFNLKPVQEWARGQYGTLGERQAKIFNELIRLCNELQLELDESVPYNQDTEYAHMALFRMMQTTSSKQYLEYLNVFTVSDLYREGTMNPDFPLYVDMHIVWPTVEEVGQIIHNNGGKIFLAHPFKYGADTDVKEILNSCLPFVDGIEICNESTVEQVEFLYGYAKENNLLVSVGNDFHGTEKHSKLGVTNITTQMEQDVMTWINKVTNKIELS